MNGDRLSVEHRGVKLEPVLKNSWLSGSDLSYVHEGDRIVTTTDSNPLPVYSTVVGIEVDPACNGDRPFPVFVVKDVDGNTHRLDQHVNKRVDSRDIARAAAVHDGWVKTAKV